MQTLPRELQIKIINMVGLDAVVAYGIRPGRIRVPNIYVPPPAFFFGSGVLCKNNDIKVQVLHSYMQHPFGASHRVCVQAMRSNHWYERNENFKLDEDTNEWKIDTAHPPPALMHL